MRSVWLPILTITVAALAQRGGRVPEREIRRGEVLVRQGEPSDALYFVVSGRFSVENERAEAIAEIGQGQPIGEIGFFAQVPRTATVRALRDSQVLTFTRERVERIGDSIPHLRDAVIASLANRLAETIRIQKQPILPRTIALVFAGNTRPSSRFLELLRQVFGKRSRPFFLMKHVIEERFPGLSLEDPAISAWLNSLAAPSRSSCRQQDGRPRRRGRRRRGRSRSRCRLRP